MFPPGTPTSWNSYKCVNIRNSCLRKSSSLVDSDVNSAHVLIQPTYPFKFVRVTWLQPKCNKSILTCTNKFFKIVNESDLFNIVESKVVRWVILITSRGLINHVMFLITDKWITNRTVPPHRINWFILCCII